MTAAQVIGAGRFARRISWGVADQGISSLTNFAFGILVARTLGLEAFGAYGLAFAAYLIVVGLSRAITAQPLLIRFSGVPLDDWRRGSAAASGTALLIGLVAVPLAIVIALITDGSLRAAFTGLALVLPGLLVQDAWRYSFFANSRGRSAFLNDLVWTVVQLAAFVTVVSLGEATVFWAVLAWGGAATLAAAFGAIQARLLPRPLQARAWWHEHRDLLPSYIGEFAAYTLSGQLMLYAIGWIAGLGAVGALRGAQVLLGPIHVIVQGAYLVAVPEAVRFLRSDPGRFAWFAVASAAILGVIAIVWTLVLVVIPTGIGTMLMADVWEAAHEVVLVWGLAFAAINFAGGAGIGLRAIAAARRTLRAASISSVLVFLGAIVGVMVAGVQGAGVGYLLMALVGIGVWWREFRLGLRDLLAANGAQALMDEPDA